MEADGSRTVSVTITGMQAPTRRPCVQVMVEQPDGTQPTLALTLGQGAYLHARLGQLLLSLRHGFPFDLLHHYGSVYGVVLLQGGADDSWRISAHRQLVPITTGQVRALRDELDRAIRALPLD